MQECTSVSELLPADVPALPFCFLPFQTPGTAQERLSRGSDSHRGMILAGNAARISPLDLPGRREVVDLPGSLSLLSRSLEIGVFVSKTLQEADRKKKKKARGGL